MRRALALGLALGLGACEEPAGPGGSDLAAPDLGGSDLAAPDLAQPDLAPAVPRWRSAWHHSLGTVELVSKVTTYRVRVRSGLLGASVRVGFFAGAGNGWLLTRAYIGRVAIGGDAPGGQQLRFAGQAGADLGDSKLVVSDAVAFPVAAGEDLYVTFAGSFVISRSWAQPLETLTSPGDVADRAELPTLKTAPYAYGVTLLDVLTPAAAPTTVCLGDSITEGIGPPGPDSSWPAQAEGWSGRPWLNSGVAGDGTDEILQQRLDPNALQLSAVDQAVVLLGTNDLIRAVPLSTIQGNLGNIYGQLGARGMRVYAATVPPLNDAAWHLDGKGEAQRQLLNAWVRRQPRFVDFDKVLEDPQRPGYLQAAYDSGDGVHPSLRGYTTMARAAVAATDKP